MKSASADIGIFNISQNMSGMVEGEIIKESREDGVQKLLDAPSTIPGVIIITTDDVTC